MTTTAANGTLRAVRLGMRLSQDDLARLLREAGADSASKRLVQRWEAGTTTAPRPAYARALEVVTGLPIEALGFTVQVPTASVAGDGTQHSEVPASGAVMRPTAAATSARGAFSGVWLSRYVYESSSRGATFASLHHVVVLQHGDRITVRSLPGSAPSEVTMDMQVDGNVITGTWAERTDPNGHYRGARYFGAIQLLAEPTGRKLIGKWVGFGKDMDVNVGPWELVFLDASTNKATLDRYNVRPQ